VSAGEPARRIWAAGGVVYRRAGARIEVVLVARPREGLWALPKGKPHDGESMEETALREVAEETGLEVAIDEAVGETGKIGSIRYSYGLSPRQRSEEPVRVRKEVHHFLMRASGGDTSRHDAEHDLVDWYDIHEAAERMTYPNERAILEQAQAVLAGGGTPS
jgi:8-oxo-dGTP pyrophosphatase MutT (NUDIX family)